MTWAIPRTTQTAFRLGDRGIGVWSLQKLLPELVADGIFGPATKNVLVQVQRQYGLIPDGIAGPTTQRKLISVAASKVGTGLPGGLLKGFAESEGGNMLAAVNWSVAGGVDCGAFQRRVYVLDYGDNTVTEHAFDTAYQASLLARRLISLHKSYFTRPGSDDGYGGIGPNEKAWRLAALAHNYPAGADRLSRTPVEDLSSYWTAWQPWVTAIGAHFPDGVRVATPLQWCHFYAGVLGAAYGTKGTVTKYVTTWP